MLTEAAPKQNGYKGNERTIETCAVAAGGRAMPTDDDIVLQVNHLITNSHYQLLQKLRIATDGYAICEAGRDFRPITDR